jgi:hypothetical protein
MFFKETFAVYFANHIKYKNALCGHNKEFLMLKPDGIYTYHYALNDL